MLVLTCCNSKHYDGFAGPFLTSLRDVARFGGPVWCVDYGLTDSQREALAGRGVVAWPARAPDGVCIPIARLHAWGRVLDMLPDTERVACYDGSDVEFQDSIDGLFDYDCLVASPETRAIRVGGHGAMLKWANGSDLRGKMKDARIINGGMVYGPARLLREYLAWAWLQYAEGQFRGFGGADQWILTFAVWSGAFSFVLDERWNYSMNVIQPRYDDLGRIVDRNGNLPAAVHWNGGKLCRSANTPRF